MSQVLSYSRIWVTAVLTIPNFKALNVTDPQSITTTSTTSSAMSTSTTTPIAMNAAGQARAPGFVLGLQAWDLWAAIAIALV